ncbi:MAG: ATP-dependent DNA helicase RecG [bacterium]
MTSLSAPVSELLGIGDKTTAMLEKAGIVTAQDFFETYPRTYREYRATDIANAQVGEWIILRGTIGKVNSHHAGHTTTQVTSFTDYKGETLALRWFNMPFLARSLNAEIPYDVMGVITEFAGRRQIVSPQLTKLSPNTYNLPPQNLYLPIYRALGALRPGMLRRKMMDVLAAEPTFKETLPLELRQKYGLISRDEALRHIHFPEDVGTLELAIRRISWEELYQLQLDNIQEEKKSRTRRATEPLKIDPQLLADFVKSLPYEPTGAQEKAIAAISHDLGEGTAMHRLLQGEVGSGKTLIAAYAALLVSNAGKKTLLLAPTTILAEQLYKNLSQLLKNHAQVALYTASSKGDLAASVLVGTHALLRAKDKLNNVGLVIVDEQHRFGVSDREALLSFVPTPHLLMMTATPIPRSLAMTVFHYLDVTRLDELPKGRLPVKTYLVGEGKRAASYTWMAAELGRSNQIFMVTPLIEISDENDETPLKSVKALSASLQEHFPTSTIDLLHGKMKDTEKMSKLTAFRDGATQILVATSMIEVGIDIPAANIMVIENAERFGLAQLHQLRGRVGRGGEQGYCLLFSTGKSAKSKDRLNYFVQEKNGEKLADYDMKTRGAGELYGTNQSGFFNLKVGNIWDKTMLEETYEAAKIYKG